MPRTIPMPADFAARALLPKPELAQRYGVSTQTVTRWRKRIGFDLRSHAKTLPPDFATFAPGKTFRDLKQRYGAGEGKIRQWRKLCGLGPAEPSVDGAAMANRIDAPPDLAARAAEMHLAELARHYGHSQKLVNRWLREAGIAAKQIRHPKPPLRVTPIRGRFVLPGAMLAAALPGPKAGREEEAAQYLRRLAAVYRCGPRGSADPDGKLWRYGTAILSASELEARARRHGWDPDEWRVLAGTAIRRDALPSFPRAGAV